MAASPRYSVCPTALTAQNVVTELDHAQKQKKAFNKANQKERAKYTNGFLEGVQGRIKECEDFQRALILGLVPPPNNDADSGNNGAGAAGGGVLPDPDSESSGSGSEPEDASGPPTKRVAKTQTTGRHKRIRTDDVYASVGARALNQFNAAWSVVSDDVLRGNTIDVASAEALKPICDAAECIADQVEMKAAELQVDFKHLDWPIAPTAVGQERREFTFGEIIALQGWLVEKLCLQPLVVTKFAPPPSPPPPPRDPRIRIDGKVVTLDCDKLGDARKEAKEYRETSENGIALVKQVLTNRGCNNQKCISCETSRGKAVNRRAAPSDGSEYLATCKCPVSTAALEFWMYKQTASDPDVPQRGSGTKASRLSFHPESLKMVGSAIKLASGLDVHGLLQSRVRRKAATALWAIEGLAEMAAQSESQYAASFPFLAQKLIETMKAWESEVKAAGGHLDDA
uniref:Uncharacterized protein n=1 Tax=Mycena chlorophos TaxID=658473 RepID=A0ABQ0LHZ2_MYCCL|nr:predicted protein [Mycena chlorophos]